MFYDNLPHLNKRRLGRKTGLIALIFSGIVLSFTHAVEVAVLGADIYSRATFPLLVTISKVNIADFLQRMDAIVILTLIIGAFFKIAIYCYSSLAVASDLFKVQKQQKLVLPFGFLVLFFSMIISTNLAEHFEEGKATFISVLPFYCAVIPILLLVVHLIRKHFRGY